MSRKLFFVATALFWLAVIAAWLGSRWEPATLHESPAKVSKRFTLADVTQHAKEEDCWMAINGKVYDLSAYIPEHPSRPTIILPWCGKEASEAYRTKMKGKPHSAMANELLEIYEIGELQDKSQAADK